MTVLAQILAGGKFTPSPELIRSCENAVAAKAHVETIRPIVEGYQRAILADGDYQMCNVWHESMTKGKIDPGNSRITEPERSYLLAAADAERYHKACNQAAKDAGLGVSKEGNCPLLEAKHLLVHAENELLEAFASDMDEKVFAEPMLLDHREKLLDIIFGLVIPHIGDAKQVLRRIAA